MEHQGQGRDRLQRSELLRCSSISATRINCRKYPKDGEVQVLEKITSWIPLPLYTRLLASWQVARVLPDPILVYQMGKVGSSTVHDSLLAAGLQSIHVHFIDEAHWKSAAAMYTHKGRCLPPHFHVGQLLRWWIRWTRRPVRVVTLVRDPIARNVSSAFEVGPLQNVPTSDVEAAVEKITKRLHADDALSYAYGWFDREIKPVLGVDVLSHSFNRAKGFARITHSHADILVLAMERLDQLVPTVLSDFAGRPLHVEHSRVRTDTVYTCVKRRLRLPERQVRALYDNPWMRHFYTTGDIVGFVEHWSK